MLTSLMPTKALCVESDCMLYSLLTDSVARIKTARQTWSPTAPNGNHYSFEESFKSASTTIVHKLLRVQILQKGCRTLVAPKQDSAKIWTIEL